MSWPLTLSLLTALVLSLVLITNPSPAVNNSRSAPPLSPTSAIVFPSASPHQESFSITPSPTSIEEDQDDFATTEDDDFNTAAQDPSPSLSSLPSLLSPSPQIAGTSQSQLYLVTRVIDGDTLQLASGATVRLIGVDTPESVHPRESVACFGKEAAAFTQQLLTGQYISLESDITDRDRYGRLLRYIYLNDRFINEYLIAEGYAESYPYPPDVKYQSRLDAAERSARAAGRGLWGACQSFTPSPLSNNPPPDPSCAIKGNINSTQEKIYHRPDCPYYNRTSIDTARGERYFCNPQEAEIAGWHLATNCP